MAKSKNKQPFALNPETPLKLIAVHKKTLETFEKKITYADWLVFKKSPYYNYYAYQA